MSHPVPAFSSRRNVYSKDISRISMDRLPSFIKDMPFEKEVFEMDSFQGFPTVVSQLLFESLRGVTDLLADMI
jgi:hypothetical protein